MYRSGSEGFQTGLSSAVTLVTSGYTLLAKAPGIGRSLTFEIVLSPSTGTIPTDVRLMQSIANGSCNFTYPATTLLQNTSSFTGSITKNAHTFAIQAKLSTASTTASGTATVRWLSVG